MKCKECKKDFFFDNKGSDSNPICKTCADKIVKQYANIEGNQNVVNQHQGDIYNFGDTDTEECYFCSKEAITHCVDCGKPLCEEHKYTILGKDRCGQHNNLHMGKMAGQGVVGTVKGTIKTISWLSSLWGK